MLCLDVIIQAGSCAQCVHMTQPGTAWTEPKHFLQCIANSQAEYFYGPDQNAQDRTNPIYTSTTDFQRLQPSNVHQAEHLNTDCIALGVCMHTSLSGKSSAGPMMMASASVTPASSRAPEWSTFPHRYRNSTELSSSSGQFCTDMRVTVRQLHRMVGVV